MSRDIKDVAFKPIISARSLSLLQVVCNLYCHLYINFSFKSGEPFRLFDDASKNPPGWSLRPRSSTRKNCRPEVSFNIMLTCHFCFFSIYPSFLPSSLFFPPFFGNCQLFSFLEHTGKLGNFARLVCIILARARIVWSSFSGASFISVTGV